LIAILTEDAVRLRNELYRAYRSNMEPTALFKKLTLKIRKPAPVNLVYLEESFVEKIVEAIPVVAHNFGLSPELRIF